jgi:nitrogenase-associated protein
MRIVFWEKPGCVGNARQKAVLALAGLEIETKNLLTHPWTKAELGRFFEGLPVSEWFNMSAPRVKRGEIVPADLAGPAAIELLLEEHLLIRRPLLEIGEQRLVGFDVARIEAAVGHRLEGGRIERVREENLEACPGQAAGIRCEDARRSDPI